MGADWQGAQDLRNRYENVGITFVATNDSQIEWALDQDWIDVVIPYHLVRTGKEVAKHFGYTNYTSESSDSKGANWKKGDKKTIYPSEHNNDKATYLAALKKANLTPRFARWVEHPNYMKLVNETRRSANETPPMQANFNVDAAKESLERMMARGGYFVPIGNDYDNMYEIAGEIADGIRASEGRQNSLSPIGEQPTKRSGWNIRGEDVAYVAPTQETSEVAPVESQLEAEKSTPDAVTQPATQLETEKSTQNSTDIAPVDNSPPPDIAEVLPSEEPLQSERDRLYAEIGDLSERYNAAKDAGEQDAANELMRQMEEAYVRFIAADDALEEENQRNLNSLTDKNAPPEVEAPYPVYLDLEESGTQKGAVERAIVFGDIIEKAGYWCGIYANLNWWNNYLKDGLERFTKWVAQYNRVCEYDGSNLDIWQYSSSGKVNGISGNVDMNICYRDFPAEILGKKTETKKEPAKTEAKTEKKTVKKAKYKSSLYNRTYKVKANGGLWLRTDAYADKIKLMSNGSKFRCYGYYNKGKDGTIWLLGVDSKGQTGFCCKSYLV